MKTIKRGVVVIVTVLVLGLAMPASAFALDYRGHCALSQGLRTGGVCVQSYRNYVDADGDGICDNYDDERGYCAIGGGNNGANHLGKGHGHGYGHR